MPLTMPKLKDWQQEENWTLNPKFNPLEDIFPKFHSFTVSVGLWLSPWDTAICQKYFDKYIWCDCQFLLMASSPPLMNANLPFPKPPPNQNYGQKLQTIFKCEQNKVYRLYIYLFRFLCKTFKNYNRQQLAQMSQLNRLTTKVTCVYICCTSWKYIHEIAVRTILQNLSHCTPFPLLPICLFISIVPFSGSFPSLWRELRERTKTHTEKCK